MEVLTTGQHKLYNLSAGRALPEFAKQRKGKKGSEGGGASPGGRQRIELLQDLEFPGESFKVKQSRDAQYLAISGTYPPMLRLYQLANLSCKVERRLDAEVVQFSLLGDDYSKVALLLADRTLELHAQYGSHCKLRIPKFGRDLCYDEAACVAYVAASGPELYRLSLQHGTFLEPWRLQAPAANVVASSPVHGLVAVGGADGSLDLFDPRAKLRVGRLADLPQRCGVPACQVTALGYRPGDAVSLLVGTSTGQALLYDVRAAAPLLVKDHYNDSPVVHASFHGPDKLVTADAQACKVWRAEDGALFGAIEAGDGQSISDVCIFRDREAPTGLVFLTGGQPRVQTYYMPALGLAPSWCSFLDSITEELEEEQQRSGAALYDDFKFLTRPELDALGLARLIGTPYLRAALHGFWMDARLYRNVRAVVDPFEYERYRAERIRDKLAAAEGTRIRAQRARLPKVNAALAQSLLQAGGAGEGEAEGEGEDKRKKKQKKKGTPAALLTDPRFAALWTSKDFAVDKSDPAYRLYHPTEAPEGYEPVADEEGEEDEDEGQPEQDDASGDRAEDAKPAAPAPKRKKVSLYELKAGYGAGAGNSGRSGAVLARPLGERLAALDAGGKTHGAREARAPRPTVFQYVPKQRSQRPRAQEHAEGAQGQADGGAKPAPLRRGIRGLPLKKLPAQALW